MWERIGIARKKEIMGELYKEILSTSGRERIRASGIVYHAPSQSKISLSHLELPCHCLDTHHKTLGLQKPHSPQGDHRDGTTRAHLTKYPMFHLVVGHVPPGPASILAKKHSSAFSCQASLSHALWAVIIWSSGKTQITCGCPSYPAAGATGSDASPCFAGRTTKAKI
jgi:hypothetical protein